MGPDDMQNLLAIKMSTCIQLQVDPDEAYEFIKKIKTTR